MYPESEIIHECKNKNPAFQRILYEKYFKEMYGVCLRYTKNSSDAKDLVHEGFIKVFENIKKFKKQCPLEFWIRRIMINTSISHVRKESSFAHLTSDIEGMEIKADQEEETDELEIKEIDPEKLLEIIQWLPTGYRTVLNLYAIEEYSHKEIAKKLKISVGTSKSQLSKARKMLKKILLNSYQQKKDEVKI